MDAVHVSDVCNDYLLLHFSRSKYKFGRRMPELFFSSTPHKGQLLNVADKLS